ncbi:hypothetical protein EV192_10217 [Actinocrispum wychmicini]|uniref:Uncharacterized protein n=1 Tax=Actinocrispum wychmicini TaxID=1213861 RepID=A0A4V2S7Z2_9PSEU|nr:hypothetical protein EV192_10217 [Actinocrispum wychmicini]
MRVVALDHVLVAVLRRLRDAQERKRLVDGVLTGSCLSTSMVIR